MMKIFHFHNVKLLHTNVMLIEDLLTTVLYAALLLGDFNLV